MFELRPARGDDRGALAELWRICFPNEEKYAAFFWDQVFEPNNALIAEQNGEPFAMLHMLPFSLRFQSEIISARYLYAIATHPSMRGRGAASALTERAMAVIRAEGGKLAYLVPGEASLFGYYQRHGFSTVAYRPVLLPPPAGLRPACTADIPHLQSLYKAYTSGLAAVERTPRYWSLLFRECEATGGEILCGGGEYFVRGTHGALREVVRGGAARFSKTPYACARLAEDKNKLLTRALARCYMNLLFD